MLKPWVTDLAQMSSVFTLKAPEAPKAAQVYFRDSVNHQEREKRPAFFRDSEEFYQEF